MHQFLGQIQCGVRLGLSQTIFLPHHCPCGSVCSRFSMQDMELHTVIGNIYESSVIFIVSDYQYISSAAEFNFGYSFCQNWFRNSVFVRLFLLFTAMQFGMTLSAGNFSRIWHVNCDNDHVVRVVTDPNPMAIKNI